MQYKTLTLELIQSRPRLYRRLRTTRRLLPVVENYAAALRENHLDWMNRLTQDRPGDDPTVLRAAGLELALTELEAELVAEDSRDGSADAP